MKGDGDGFDAVPVFLHPAEGRVEEGRHPGFNDLAIEEQFQGLVVELAVPADIAGRGEIVHQFRKKAAAQIVSAVVSVLVGHEGRVGHQREDQAVRRRASEKTGRLEQKH